VSVDAAKGEVCPLRRGKPGVDFNNVVDDGGAGDDEVSNMINMGANYLTQDHSDHTIIKRRQQRFNYNFCRNMRVCEGDLRVHGAFRGNR
jgi:hypothetical protein